jgi:hypothetical protein
LPSLIAEIIIMPVLFIWLSNIIKINK